MSTYPEPQPGEWIAPQRKYYYMQCCDCGLVHKIEFALWPWKVGKKIWMRAWRDNRRTGQVRRWRGIKVKYK